MKLSRKYMYAAAAPLMIGALTLPAIAQAGATVVPPPPVKTEIVLKDGRGLDAQYAWQYNKVLHRWVYGLTGKVIVDRNEIGRFSDMNQSEHFKLVYGPLGQKAFIQYTGPGAYHNWYVKASDKKAPGVPANVPWGYQGSKLVKFGFEATLFNVSAPGPLGYRTLTVAAQLGLGGHGPEILTGEMFGQLGLNAQRPLALPTNAQLFMQR